MSILRTVIQTKGTLPLFSCNSPHSELCRVGEDDYDTWHTLVLHSLKLPTSCIIVDANESGFNDCAVFGLYAPATPLTALL